jgi:hypothetical protein
MKHRHPTPIRRQGSKNVPVNSRCYRQNRAQHAAALVGQPYGIGARIFLCAPTLHQAIAFETAHDVGERGPVDADALHEVRLAQALVLLDRQEDNESRGVSALLVQVSKASSTAWDARCRTCVGERWIFMDSNT